MWKRPAHTLFLNGLTRKHNSDVMDDDASPISVFWRSRILKPHLSWQKHDLTRALLHENRQRSVEQFLHMKITVKHLWNIKACSQHRIKGLLQLFSHNSNFFHTIENLYLAILTFLWILGLHLTVFTAILIFLSLHLVIFHVWLEFLPRTEPYRWSYSKCMQLPIVFDGSDPDRTRRFNMFLQNLLHFSEFCVYISQSWHVCFSEFWHVSRNSKCTFYNFDMFLGIFKFLQIVTRFFGIVTCFFFRNFDVSRNFDVQILTFLRTLTCLTKFWRFSELLHVCPNFDMFLRMKLN